MVSGRVSRLYNTLEKIRTGEQGGFPQKKSAPAKGIGRQTDPRKRRRIILLGASALLALALIVFFSGPNKPPLFTNTVAPARIPDHPTEPAPQASPPVPLTEPSPATGDLYRQLNDTGIALVQENQHWRGIYHLEQARKQQPERPETLINMAVALAELGLRAPAKRLFSEAHALAPNHPLLRQNLDLLGQADFFNGHWLSSLTAGQIPPGQAPKPQ